MVFYEDDLDKYQVVPNMVLKKQQLEAIDFCLHKFNCIINLKTGLGKCKKGSSTVVVDGVKRRLDSLVENPKEGITPLRVRLWTGTGWDYTKNFYYEKNCRVITWKLSNGKEVNGTYEHKILVYRGYPQLVKKKVS